MIFTTFLGCWKGLQGSDGGVLPEKRLKEERERGCDYVRLWKDPDRVASPVHGSYLHTWCMNQLHEISSQPCCIPKKKKDGRLLLLRVKSERERFLSLLLCVEREDISMNNHWQWEQLRDSHSYLWGQQSLTNQLVGNGEARKERWLIASI